MANADHASAHADPASMDMIWLEDFSALVSTGNFSRAAMLRHVTQPAFSRRIRALEDWFGIPLFDREAQPVTLTPAGRRFEPAAQDMLRRIAQTREDVRAVAQSRTLRFAATHVLSFTFFPGWFHHLAAGAAPAAVHLTSDHFQACEQRMLLGQVHFLLCHHHPAAPSQLDAARFPSIEIGRDALCLVAAPHLARSPVPNTRPMLAYSQESGLGRIIAAAAPTQNGTVPAFTSHLAATLRTLALDGRGLAWLPLSVVGSDLAAGTLVRMSGVEFDIDVEIRVVRPSLRQDDGVEAFWDLLQNGAARDDRHFATERPVSSEA